MPYGVTWGFYIKRVTSSLLATFAGSHAVHLYYSPDLSIPEVPPKKGELHTKLYTNNIFFQSNSEKQEK